jgi:hypothetical protein
MMITEITLQLYVQQLTLWYGEGYTDAVTPIPGLA